MHDGSILMTIGDHSYKREELALDNNAHWGKIMQIKPRDWSARIFSKGHRNPQGLLVTADAIWSTQHGPEGGDELNKLEFGANHGWPFETYGTDYGRKKLFEVKIPGQHLSGKRPFYSWVPSIGTSNLIKIESAAFPAWRGDLMVSSLNGRFLFRMRIRENRVVTMERIKIGERTRDLVEMPDGTIILWNGQDTLTVMEPANYVLSKCSGCHSLQGGSHGIGPDLYKIVRRKVANGRGYAYSKAMRNYRGRWTPERLEKFLANPEQEVPGTQHAI